MLKEFKDFALRGNLVDMAVGIIVIIVAVVMFLIIKAMNRMKKETPAAPSGLSRSEDLLTEIRDLLKNNA